MLDAQSSGPLHRAITGLGTIPARLRTIFQLLWTSLTGLLLRSLVSSCESHQRESNKMLQVALHNAPALPARSCGSYLPIQSHHRPRLGLG